MPVPPRATRYFNLRLRDAGGAGVFPAVGGGGEQLEVGVLGLEGERDGLQGRRSRRGLWLGL